MTKKFSGRSLFLASLVLAATAIATIAMSFRQRSFETALRAERLTLYEGLPHPLYEDLVFEDELETKPTVKFQGFPFYRDPIPLKNEDVIALRKLVGDRKTYAPDSGEKKCGGFHPDYALEWSVQGKVYRALYCFGCMEVVVERPDGRATLFDLQYQSQSGSGKGLLFDQLKLYRQNRPPHDHFGSIARTP